MNEACAGLGCDQRDLYRKPLGAVRRYRNGCDGLTAALLTVALMTATDLPPQSLNRQQLSSSCGLAAHLSRSLARMQQEGSGHGSLETALLRKCVAWFLLFGVGVHVAHAL